MNSSTGIWLPPGTESPGSVLASDIIPEAQRIVAWIRAWPRKGEPPLQPRDVATLVFTRAQVNFWDREKMDAILKIALSELGMNQTPQAAAKAEKRKGLRAVCDHLWRDPNASFLTCKTCGYITQRPLNPSGAPEPSRVLRTDEASMQRISSRVTDPEKAGRLKQRMPS